MTIKQYIQCFLLAAAFGFAATVLYCANADAKSAGDNGSIMGYKAESLSTNRHTYNYLSHNRIKPNNNIFVIRENPVPFKPYHRWIKTSD